MRLLEFSDADNDADLYKAAHIAPRVKPVAPPPWVQPVLQGSSKTIPEARVFPVKTGKVQMPAQRGPIDLEHLQQRVLVLEKRIKIHAQDNPASRQDLEQLKERLLKLERSIIGELWAAKQREYTLLEMLAKPPLALRIGKLATGIWTHRLPAIGRWLLEASREWWQDRQPEWWPRVDVAWQESLDHARDSFASK